MKPRTIALAVLGLSLSIAGIALAWTGPSSAPTGGNVTAPVNVGGTTQEKSGALTVDGTLLTNSNIGGNNIALYATNPVIDFSGGSSAYGIRFSSSNGTMQFRDSGGTWTAFSSLSGSGLTGTANAIPEYNSNGSGLTNSSLTDTGATLTTTDDMKVNPGSGQALFVSEGANAYNNGLEIGNTTANNSFYWVDSGGAAHIDAASNGNQNILLDGAGTTGDVGIRTITPGYALDVNGTVNATKYCISAANCITSWPSGSGGLSGSGTTNKIAVFTGSSALGNSSLTDNGTTLTSTDNVTVNPSSSGQSLIVNQYADASGNGIRVTNAEGTRSGYLWVDSSNNVRLDSASGGTSPLLLNAGGGNVIFGGNVGIGTASPASLLEVDGWVATDGNTGWKNATYGIGLYAIDSTWVRTWGGAGLWAGSANIGTNGGLTVGYGGANAPSGGAIFSGNVGINNSSPGYALDVTGTVNAARYCISGANCITSWPSGGSGFTGSGTTNKIAVFTGSSALGNSSLTDNGTTLTSTDNVAINPTSTSNQALVVNQAANAYNNGLRIGNSGSNSVFYWTDVNGAAHIDADSSGNHNIFLDGTGTGNVGINTTSPDQALTVAGKIHTTSGGVEFPDGTVQTTVPTLTTCNTYLCTPTCSSGKLTSQTTITSQYPTSCAETGSGGSCIQYNFAYTYTTVGICS